MANNKLKQIGLRQMHVEWSNFQWECSGFRTGIKTVRPESNPHKTETSIKVGLESGGYKMIFLGVK
jgi:hypothetical protein